MFFYLQYVFTSHTGSGLVLWSLMYRPYLQREHNRSLNYQQSCEYLRRRWPRLESRSEILKKFKAIKQARGQDMRAFLVEFENLLNLMKLHGLERGVFDVVDALKEKCDDAVVKKVLALPDSETQDENQEP